MKTRRREPWNPLLKSYPDSEKINACSIGAETLYTRLLAQSDDDARYYADPKMVLAKLYTMRMVADQVNIEDVAGWLRELEAQRLITRYEAEGKTYLEIVNCKKSLRNDVNLDRRFPGPGAASKEYPPTPAPRNEDVTSPGRTCAENGPPTQPNPTQPDPTQPNPSRDGADASPMGFDRFWGTWPDNPRKTGRSKCAVKWAKDNLDAKADQIIAAVERCKRSAQWRKKNGEYIPKPLNWLEDEGWEATKNGQADQHESSNGDEWEPRDPTPEEQELIRTGGSA